MRLVVDVDGSRLPVELAQHADDATLADLVRSCGTEVADGETLWVDARRHRGSDLLRDITFLDGSTVARTGLVRPEPLRGWVASVSGGLDAGRVVPVPDSRPLVVGRSPQADLTTPSPSASWTHAVIAREGAGLRVRDAGSTNRTFVDGVRVPDGGVLVEGEAVVLVGGTAITLRPDPGESLAPAPGSLHNLTLAGTAPFNRPPRPGRLPAPEAVRAVRRKDPPPPSRLSVATVVGPLVLAVAMVILTGDLRFAVLAALSPVLGVGTWFEQKRRRVKDIASEDERFEEALGTLRADVARAAAVERARRRDEVPDPAVLLRRAALPTTRLWQRRPGATDFLALHGGVGDVPWAPHVEDGTRLDDAVKEVVARSHLPAAPVEVDLTAGGVVGVVGDRAGALAVARSLLCQAATHCGPADLTVGVFCDAGREDAWAWTSWLPHVRRLGEGSGGQWVSADRQRSERLLRALRDGIEAHPTPAVLLVIDSDVLTEGRDSPGRSLLGHGRPDGADPTRRPVTQVSGIVVAATREQLPASCTMVLHVDEDAAGTATRPGELDVVDDVVVAGVALATAERCALDLARFDDPELVVPGASLPSMVRLPGLLGLAELDGESIRRRWSSGTRITTPIGIGEAGVLELDLVRDGPHGLVGGTTGSGKSEFLRSLVTGLAATNDPTRLTFILVDFKGGAAFAKCERLPHTIGTVSNLDARLADRALRALRAELEHRQQLFADAGEGIDDIDAYWATRPEVPLPRLLLVIDEFAMLADDEEYHGVLSSLVSIAAEGRTLGVHMILATQRPAGVVNDDILANTNLRVALRVQSRDDSANVIGVPDAAAIGRTQWGRAFVKLGQDDISPVQTALVTGRSEEQSQLSVELHPLAFGVDHERATPAVADDRAPTDLDRLIDAIVAADDQAGYAAPRPVWPEPLGDRVDLADVGRVDGTIVAVALADDPDGQRQVPVGWDLARGNLLLLGIPGSGTSTTLSSLALTMAAEWSPEELDLLVLDLGSGDLAALEELPHTTAYVGSGAGAREQQARFITYVRAELDRRRAAPGPHRRMVLLVDGLAALKDEYADADGLRLLDALHRVYADGPEVQMWCVATSARPEAVPGAIDDVTTQRWLFELADPYDYGGAGVPARLAPRGVPGRCVVAEARLQAHVATPATPVAEAVARLAARWDGAAPKPSVVGQLPENVTVADLGVVASVIGEPWWIPVGIAEGDLQPTGLESYEGEHLLIAGPPRSGKSSLLLGMARAIRLGALADQVDVVIWGVCGRRSPLAEAGLERCVVGEDGLAELLAAARVHPGNLVLLVDDAEQFEDPDQALAGLVSARLPHLRVIAAGRNDDLRSLYSHWTRAVRKSRAGVLLQPNVDYDGELLGVTLPRQAPVALEVGRGYAAMGGAIALVQSMTPS